MERKINYLPILPFSGPKFMTGPCKTLSSYKFYDLKVMMILVCDHNFMALRLFWFFCSCGHNFSSSKTYFEIVLKKFIEVKMIIVRSFSQIISGLKDYLQPQYTK